MHLVLKEPRVSGGPRTFRRSRVFSGFRLEDPEDDSQD